jgi:coenzyme F420-0:L-glutamate ligase / coenzyme F420-1:gamma-L-glutamate ligase
MITAAPLEGLPEIEPGDDLAEVIATGLAGQSPPEALGRGDVLVVAHKVVSKSEGRLRALADVAPGPEAERIGAEQGRDPRQVQVVLDESRSIIRAAGGVLTNETHHGYICANAGVDASNVDGGETLLLLPADPDGSARRLRARLRELIGVAPGVVITDSFGRAWRTGQSDIAIGIAGVSPLEDWRGQDDAYGREMHATVIGVADLLAGTADLARRKDGLQPVVLIRGAERHVTAEDGPGAAALIRAPEQDLFR